MTPARRRELIKRFHPDLNGGSNRFRAQLQTILAIPMVKYGMCQECGAVINENAKRCRVHHQAYLASRRLSRRLGKKDVDRDAGPVR